MLEKFIPYSTQSISQSDKDAVIEALFSSHLTQGHFTQEFEKKLANYIQVKHAISFNSATSALYAAFNTLKECVYSESLQQDFLDSKQNLFNAPNFAYAKKHKKISILTTPISFVATSNMMLANDIVPIFGDISMNGNLKLKGLESLLREDTLAVCSVDYAGNSVEVDLLREFANKHNLIWISDSSHAFGGSINGEKVGSRADMSIFSFHAVKPITTCEGGALVCNDDFYAQHARLVCSHGIVKKTSYNHDCVTLGFNFRLNEIGASLGISQLQQLESFLLQREKIAQFYDSYFESNPYFYTTPIQANIKSTRHLYPILLDSKYICMKEHIINELLAQNVGVQVHYKPIYNFKLYQAFNYPILRNAEDFYHAEISLPCHQNMDLEIAKEIADIVLQTFEKYTKKC